mmetsp:Transcript_42047/g.105734  ORF Transcript_42047/g.105734 Transcript_42047/m.105734 type:complete len:200 (-) Transcript_42047:426-1025(-)
MCDGDRGCVGVTIQVSQERGQELHHERYTIQIPVDCHVGRVQPQLHKLRDQEEPKERNMIFPEESMLARDMACVDDGYANRGTDVSEEQCLQQEGAPPEPILMGLVDEVLLQEALLDILLRRCTASLFCSKHVEQFLPSPEFSLLLLLLLLPLLDRQFHVDLAQWLLAPEKATSTSDLQVPDFEVPVLLPNSIHAQHAE